jgi:hypothetical protein
MYRSAHGGSGHDPAGQIGTAIGQGVVGIAIVALLVGLYLAWRGLLLVMRVFSKYPHHKALWTAFVVCLVSWMSVGLAPGVEARVLSVIAAIICTLGLLVTARVVEVVEDQFFQVEPEALTTRVLKRAWWE